MPKSESRKVAEKYLAERVTETGLQYKVDLIVDSSPEALADYEALLRTRVDQKPVRDFLKKWKRRGHRLSQAPQYPHDLTLKFFDLIKKLIISITSPFYRHIFLPEFQMPICCK